MKVALYARVSRHDKDQNPENQLIKLREYASRHKWAVSGEFSDYASGLTPKRERFDEMYRQARARRFDAILAVKIDRIGRSVRHLQNLLEDLSHFGVELICTDQNIDTSSPMGKFFFDILSAVAELELELIRERTKDGIARARAEGKRLGRPPFSVSNDEILNMRAEGMSLRQIAERVGMSHQGVKKRLRQAT